MCAVSSLLILLLSPNYLFYRYRCINYNKPLVYLGLFQMIVQLEFCRQKKMNYGKVFPKILSYPWICTLPKVLTETLKANVYSMRERQSKLLDFLRRKLPGLHSSDITVFIYLQVMDEGGYKFQQRNRKAGEPSGEGTSYN